MIEVKNVTKKYGNFVAVDNISFTVNDGEVVGFLGPNGAGKSTTMNMITGFIEPTDGTIIVNGFDASKQPIKAKQQIGYMPEGVPLYTDLTVKEFVTYMAELKRVPHKEKKERVTNVLRETGIEDVANRLIKNLSRGYKQRVSLAGALVGDPKIVILDEPTVGLDPKQITEIRQLIKRLGKKHTVILSSHILSEVSQICEKVIIINKGKIVAVDTPANLEKETEKQNVIMLTVEDKRNNMKALQNDIPEITECKCVKDNDDGTKQYMLKSSTEFDLRKKLFDVLPKKDITIFELKSAEKSLEDAFITIIDENTKKRRAEAEAAEKAKEHEKELKEESKKAQKEEKAENKESYMWNEYEITYRKAFELKSDDFNDKSSIRENIAGIRREMKSLGDVNINAIEEFKEINERYQFMKGQHDDLVEAEQTLLGIIEDLDSGMRKQFLEKFAEIQREFNASFKHLFGGGHGALELVEDEDILECGIRIIAQPPGKKLQNMMQMSGGEKALTAIALLFAIQALKPSPFCLLDEIEAALDDSNVSRFASYLNKLTKNTQFIVITHRRGTMTAADRLYGITMQEKGVSTLVSVDLIEHDLN